MSRPAAPVELPEEELMEMPGDSIAIDDDDKLELDIEGDDALDFPDDSLVLPVTEAKPTPATPPSRSDAGTMLADDLEIDAEGAATIAMAAIDTDAGVATIAMQALSDDGEAMSEDLSSGDSTILAMEAPPWDGPTDEHNALRDTFEELTDPSAKKAEPPPRKFAIPAAATTVDLNPPSAMEDSEHDRKAEQPKVGIPGESTRAYTLEELKKLGVKPKE